MIHTTQAITDPAAHTRKAWVLKTRGLQISGLAMNASLANHVVNKGDIINYIAQRRDGIAKHLPGFAIGFKIPNGF